METGLNALHIPELGDGGFSSWTRCQDMLSPWLDMDDHCNPNLPEELLNLNMLDDNFFQFATSQLGADSVSNLPRPESDDAFLLDIPHSQPNMDTASMLLDTNVDMLDNTDMFLSEYDMFQPASTECHRNLAAPAVVDSTVASTSTTSSTTTTTSPETAFDALTPSTNVTINMSSPALWKDEEDDHMDQSNNTKPITINCKNLVSERNRRKRLSQQLLALRALVPNITKMDKRSVLVDALAYLRSIHEETARIQGELKEGARNNTQTSLPCHAVQHPPGVATGSIPRPQAEILQIETEKMEDRRFIVKITCKGGPGVGGEVLHVIESLGLEITYIALEQLKPQLYITTVFIRVRKQGKMTEEKLKDCITSTALRSCISLKDM